jgi:hypothetical protein
VSDGGSDVRRRQFLVPRVRAGIVFRTLRENGPVVLVPLAWTFAAAAHLGLVGSHPLFVAHVVMSAILVAFVVLSWSEMRTGVLLAWKLVIAAGFAITLVGTVALLAPSPDPRLLGVTVVGWMLIPAAGLAYTGRHVGPDEWPLVYTAGAVCSVVGAAVYVGGPLAVADDVARLAGLALAGVGQTAGIVAAVVEY